MIEALGWGSWDIAMRGTLRAVANRRVRKPVLDQVRTRSAMYSEKGREAIMVLALLKRQQ